MALWRSHRSPPASTKLSPSARTGLRVHFMVLLLCTIGCSIVAIFYLHPETWWRSHFPISRVAHHLRSDLLLSSSSTSASAVVALPTIARKASPPRHGASSEPVSASRSGDSVPISGEGDSAPVSADDSSPIPDHRSTPADAYAAISAAAPSPEADAMSNGTEEFSAFVVEHFPGITQKIKMDQMVPVDELGRLLDAVGRDRHVAPSAYAGGRSPVMATFASKAFEDFLLNWIHHVRRLGLGDLILVAALDKPTLQICEREKVPAILLDAGLGQGDFRGVIGKFRAMGAPKVEFILRVLELGRDIIVSDTDTVWVGDPLNFLTRDGPMAGADICVTSDSLSPRHDALSEVAVPDNCCWFENLTERTTEQFGSMYASSFNTGVLVLRSTEPAKNFSRLWFEVLRTSGEFLMFKDLYDDQDAFNRIMWQGMDHVQVVFPEDGSKPNNRILWMNHYLVKMGLLPPALFCNGHVYFVQRAHERTNVQPFVVHNTFQFHSVGGKKMRFMEAGLWKQNDTYFEGDFLSFDTTLPPDLLANEDNDIDRHIGALEYVMLSTRNALAIAHALGRILILPEVICFCDKFWSEMSPTCRLPGVDFDPPYICPGDHLFNCHYFVNSPFPFRVRTFLKDPQLPSAILDSMKVIKITELQPEEGSLRANSSASEVREALGRYKGVRLLHLESTATAFSKFDEVSENQWFQDKVWGIFGPEDWCCKPGDPNHYDEKNHRSIQPPVPLIGFDHWAKVRWRPKQKHLVEGGKKAVE